MTPTTGRAKNRAPAELLEARSAAAYLERRHIDIDGPVTVTALGGGVSGTILLVESPHHRLVLKQALGKLLVEAPWFADPGRAMTEASALVELHAISPAHTPKLVDASPDDCAIVMTAAPSSWSMWKSHLLVEPLDRAAARSTAATLGTVLGRWHATTAGVDLHDTAFADHASFEELRIEPFHRAILDRHPEVAGSVEACVADLAVRRECLVHGDFSPKNVLVNPSDPRDLWILDLEVAHWGAAVFDIAFLQHHLMLKAIHRPAAAEAFEAAASDFLMSYRAEVGLDLFNSATRLLSWQTASLLLARVEGLSPAGYLTKRGRDRARELAREVLLAPDRPVEDTWRTLERIDHH